jgi:predicted transcriptional regulator
MAETFRPRQPGLRKLFGDLEADVMEYVWAQGPGARLSVRQVYEAFRDQRQIAYTTVMTVMGNLAKKGVLAVEGESRAYLYHAPLTREQFTAQAVGAIVDDLLEDFADPALAHFTKALADRPETTGMLERLRALVDAKQQPPSDQD